MNGHVSYWLTPAEPHQRQWSEIVHSLASRFNAPIFEPHVTIYSGPLHPSDRLQEIIHAATRGVSEFVLDATGIGHTAQFTKTLFIEFAAHNGLAKLSRELQRHSSTHSDYELKPHLSLIYATLSSEMKRQLAREILLPPRVRFDTVKAMVSHGSARIRADIEAWQIVADAKLSAE